MQPTLLHTLLALAVSAASLNAHAAAYNSNLIVNGDAEAGVSGWTALDMDTPLFITVEYGDNWVQPTEPGPADRGLLLFAGASGFNYSGGYQVLDLSANAADIATGKVGFQLSGWLGGWTTQSDNAILMASFQDAGGNELGFAQLGPVMPEDRGNATGLVYRMDGGFLPGATAQVEFKLDMERLNSYDNDGYADNLSFTMAMAPVPEPETYALMLAGLGLVGVAARRSRAAR
ncbi:MAG: PEP-CTERM sorting domain-containing protein [Pseudomonadota bacterium]